MRVSKIERLMSPIGKEPQTLSLDQIKYAREVALYVISNNTMEEAFRIFTEGLEPVSLKNGKNEMELTIMMESDTDTDSDLDEDEVENERLERDIATAPF